MQVNIHEKYQELLSALLDGELTDAERADALAHLDGCAACPTYFAGLNAMRAAFAEPEDVPVPEGFAAGILTRLHEEDAKKVSAFPAAAKPRAPWRKWGALAACAAVVALAAAVLPNAMRMGKSASESAVSVQSMAPAMAPAMAPPDMTRESASDRAEESGALSGGTGGAEAFAVAGAASTDAPAAPIEPAAPAGGAVAESRVQTTANDAGVPVSIVTCGPEDESLYPELTLCGADAAVWLADNGWQGASGEWYADAAALRALPEGLTVDEDAALWLADYEGVVRVLTEETEAAP